MELTSKAHEQCYGLVKTYLTQAFGELAEPDLERPSFSVVLKWRVYVDVSALGDDAAAVDIYTWVGEGIGFTADVGRFLLERNGHYRGAACGLDSDGDIIVQWPLLDDALSKEALKHAVRAVSYAAEEIENQLTMQFR